MTGEKNRYSSVEKLWKLDDETLKTPKHDELVISLLNSEIVADVISDVYAFLNEPTVFAGYCGYNPFFHICTDSWQRLKSKDKTFKDSELIKLGKFFQIEDSTIKVSEMKGTKEEVFKYIKETMDLDFSNKISAIIKNDKIWYCNCIPISIDEFFPKLYVAEKVWIQDAWDNLIFNYYDGIKKFEKTHRRHIEINSEVPIMTSNAFLVGYWDIVISSFSPRLQINDFVFRWNKDTQFSKLFIEVKPRIDSFGATLRQLRTYQQYEQEAEGNTYLFTPDLRFKDAFESQGIQVISPMKAKEGDNIK